MFLSLWRDQGMWKDQESITKPSYERLHITGGISLAVSEEFMTIMLGNMVAGRQAWCWDSSWELTSELGGRGGEGVSGSDIGLWNLKAIPRDAPSQATLPKQFYKLGTKYSNLWVYGDDSHFLIQTTTLEHCDIEYGVCVSLLLVAGREFWETL